MISINQQYGVRSPLVAQYHPIGGKKVCHFNKDHEVLHNSPAKPEPRLGRPQNC
jgi:hypothetical protein